MLLISRDARQPLAALTVMTLLAAVAPCASVAQSALGSAADRERQILEDIDQAQSLGGPHAEMLIGPLTSLALLYQENGDTVPALAAIEQVLQVIRANYGLHSLEQAPLIWQLIANQETIGNADAAWDLQQELLELARRHPEDLRSVPIFRGLADRRFDLLQRYIAGEWPREFFLGCYYGFPGHSPLRQHRSCGSGSRSFAINRILGEVQRYYAEAIAVILRNGIYSSEELRELELAAVRATFASGLIGRGLGCRNTLGELLAMEPLESCLAPIRQIDENITRINVGGASSLVRLLSYEVRSSASASTQLSALVRLADYLHWLRGRSSRNLRVDDSALSLYALALEQMTDLGEASMIEDVFSPAVPVVLPEFVPSPLVSAETPDSTGRIDVAFDIGKSGEGTRLEIVATSGVSRDAEKALVRSIEETSFRPRAAGGELLESSRVTVRYYVSE